MILSSGYHTICTKMRLLKPLTGKLTKRNIKTIIRFLFSFNNNNNNNKHHISNFESLFSRYIGTKNSIMTSSARFAFSKLLDYLGLEKDSEIILPAYTYHVMPQIIIEKGLRPVFIDVNLDDKNISIEELKKAITKKTKVIIATHIFGNPCKINDIMKLAKKNNIFIIEDCTHSLGARFKNRKVGGFGDCGLFSFNKEKNIDCLNGGMIVTNSDKIAKYMKDSIDSIEKQKTNIIVNNIFSSLEFTLRNFTIIDFILKNTKDAFLHRLKSNNNYTKKVDNNKYNCKPHPIQAIIGIQQLQKLDTIQEKRNRNVDIIYKELEKNKRITLTKSIPNSHSVNLIFEIFADKSEKLQKYLWKHWIYTQHSYMDDCNSIKQFKRYWRKCPNAKKIRNQSIMIPISHIYNKNDMLRVSNRINNFYESIKTKK